MRMTRLSASHLLAGVCLLGFAVSASAQDTRDATTSRAQFGEIVVTARSQAESLMDVPVAVTALTAEDVARYATTDMMKLAQLRPEVEIYDGGSRSGAAFIVRGIGTTADTAGVESSVSIAIDGIQTHRPRVIYMGMFDVGQVEIMKGPQALFFGKNASAGVVSIKTADPGDVLSGYVRGGFEFEARERYAEAAIDVPITETLRTRFAGRYSKMRGWTKNVAQATPDPLLPSVILPAPHYRYNGRETLAGRVTVVWEPSSNYSSKFKATFASYEDNGPTQGSETVCASGNVVYNTGFADPYQDCRLNGVTGLTDVPAIYAQLPAGLQSVLRPGRRISSRWNNGVPFSDAKSMLLSWEQHLDLGPVSIQSVTGHSTLKYSSRGNFNYSSFALNAGGSDEDFTGWSQELRLVSNLEGPFNFTLGGFYERQSLWGSSALRIAALGPDPVTGSHMSGVNEAKEKQRTWSLFGQARYEINDQLELAGGVRYTKVKKHAFQGQPGYVHAFLNGTALLGTGDLFEDRLREDNWSPEASLTWQPNSDTTIYAAYKTGYKTGGIAQPALVTPGNTMRVFNPEKVRGGELGYKGYLMDRRIRLSATAFIYKFKGLQLTSFDPVLSAYRIQNAADVKQKGIEVDAEFRADDNLTLRGSAAYISNKYGRFTGASCYTNQLPGEGAAVDWDDDGDPNTIGNGISGDQCNAQDLSGRNIHRSPKFVASAGISYDTEVSNSLRIGLSGDVRYRSGTYTIDNFNPASYQKSYAMFHANARIYDEDKGWELSLIGRNLTNKRVIAFASARPGATTPGQYEVSAFTIRPREIALQASLNF